MSFDVSPESSKMDIISNNKTEASMELFDKRVEPSSNERINRQNNFFDPDKRIDSYQKEINSSKSNSFDPDKRVEALVNNYELSDETKAKLLDAGMTQSNIDKCTIDRKGVVILNTNNFSLEGNNHPETGVKYERGTIDLNGIKIEGVFPKFDSIFVCKLPSDKLKASDTEQFKECMSQLRAKIGSNPELAKKFDGAQLEQINDYNLFKIRGFIWHHSENPGEMQLVLADKHGLTPHTGGKSIWGGGSKLR